MPKPSELPIDRANRRLRNKGRESVNVVLAYEHNGVKRELRLHDTKGYRDVRAG